MTSAALAVPRPRARARRRRPPISERTRFHREWVLTALVWVVNCMVAFRFLHHPPMFVLNMIATAFWLRMAHEQYRLYKNARRTEATADAAPAPVSRFEWGFLRVMQAWAIFTVVAAVAS